MNFLRSWGIAAIGISAVAMILAAGTGVIAWPLPPFILGTAALNILLPAIIPVLAVDDFIQEFERSNTENF